MGAWDVGPFDNDTAADFGGDLDEAPATERESVLRRALIRTIGTTGDLEARAGEEAVAAAALVAAQCPGGEPACPHYGPEEPLPDLTALRPLALAAVDRVLTAPSELLDLWTGAEGDAWEATIRRLRTTLLPPPPEEAPGSFRHAPRRQARLAPEGPIIMSWEVLLARLPDVASVDEMSDDFVPPPLGAPATVLPAVRQAVPSPERPAGAVIATVVPGAWKNQPVRVLDLTP